MDRDASGLPTEVAQRAEPGQPMGRRRLILGAALASLMAVAVGVGASLAGQSGRVVEIDIHYSHFLPATITVPAGVPIRFILVNQDPIDHEWIVGDEAVHAAHRTGTELSHGARPTEQSIVAGRQVETVVTFATPGVLTFVCHLPGHEAYGMTGTLTVTASR